jgi:hypothetical protein
LAKIRSYEAPHYAALSSLLSLHPSQVQIFSSDTLKSSVISHEKTADEVALQLCFPSSFDFPLLVKIPPLIHSHLLPLSEPCSGPYQAAHYHILGLYIWGFITFPSI